MPQTAPAGQRGPTARACILQRESKYLERHRSPCSMSHQHCSCQVALSGCPPPQHTPLFKGYRDMISTTCFAVCCTLCVCLATAAAEQRADTRGQYSHRQLDDPRKSEFKSSAALSPPPHHPSLPYALKARRVSLSPAARLFMPACGFSHSSFRTPLLPHLPPPHLCSWTELEDQCATTAASKRRLQEEVEPPPAPLPRRCTASRVILPCMLCYDDMKVW